MYVAMHFDQQTSARILSSLSMISLHDQGSIETSRHIWNFFYSSRIPRESYPVLNAFDWLFVSVVSGEI